MNIFNGLKKGDSVVKILIGGGCETATIKEIEKIDKKTNTLYLEGCNKDYNRQSLYAFDTETGYACESLIPGFTSRLIYLEE